MAEAVAPAVVGRGDGHGPGRLARGRRAEWRRRLRTRAGQENIYILDGHVSRVRRRRAVPVGRRTRPAVEAEPEAQALEAEAEPEDAALEEVAPGVSAPRAVLVSAGRPGQFSAPRSVSLVAWNQRRSFALHADALADFLAILKRCRWELCAVAAAWRWRESGRYEHGEFVCLWSQRVYVDVGKQHYGVGLFLHRSVLPSLRSWLPVSSRVLVARFSLARGRFLTVMAVYAPVSSQTSARKAFFREVREVAQSVAQSDFFAIVGDVNSQVGRAMDASQGGVLGPEWDSVGLGTGGADLFALCEALGLCVASTFFRHPASARRSHELIGGGTITNDHVLVRREQLSCVQDVRVRQGDERLNLGFCRSDHHPLVTTLCVKMRAEYGGGVRVCAARARPDLRLLACRPVAERYAEVVEQQLEKLGNGEVEYENLAAVLKAAAEEVVPQQVAARGPTAGLSDVVRRLSEERAALYRQAGAAGTLRDPTVRERLRTLRRQLRNRQTREQRRAMTAVADRLQRLERAGSAAQFYSELARASEARQPQGDVLDAQGRLCTRDADRAAAFRAHFSPLLNGAGGRPSEAVREEFKARAASAVRAADSPAPSEAQVLEAVSQQKLGRAADEFGMSSDLMRAAATPGSRLAALLTDHVADVWRDRAMPRERCRSVMVPIYKNKGDRQAVTNYRGVTLVQFLWRVVMRLVMGPTMIPGVEAILPEAQCGSRPQRGCVDQLFSLRILQDQALAQRVALYAAFIDLAKAFDSIDRALLFDMLAACGFPVNEVEIFESMYSSTTCAVRSGREVGEGFETSVGVQQGCISGSWCFCLFLHFVFDPILDELNELGVSLRLRARDGRCLDARELRAGKEAGVFGLGVLFIVDDTTLLSDTVEGLRRGLALVYERLTAFGLVVNAQKSDAIAFAGIISHQCVVCERQDGRDSQTLLCEVCGRACHVSCAGLNEVPEGEWWCDGCGGEVARDGVSQGCGQDPVDSPLLPFGDGFIAWTDSVKYLGAHLTADCGLTVELTYRIRLARAAYRRLRPLVAGGRMARGMRGTFARAFSSLTQSVLLYGSAAWALAEPELERLEVVQRGLLRQALPLARRRDVSNKKLYELFRVPSVATLWAREQLRWLGHLARADGGRIAQRLLGAVRAEAGRVGRGNRGATLLGGFGQKGVLLEHLERHLTATARRRFFDGERGEWFRLAQHKNKWRAFVNAVKA